MKMQTVKLPDYTGSEDRINAFTHVAGVPFGIIALVLCLDKSIKTGSPWSVAASAVYGASLIVLYLGSAMYHSANPGKYKKAMRIIDHCMVFLLIAGSVTPYALVAFRPAYPLYCWLALAVAWGAALVGITLTSINHEKFKAVQMVLYIATGWTILLGMKYLRIIFNGGLRTGLRLLVLGGVLYTLGAIIFGIGVKKPYFHSLFHLFVLAGSVLHFISIYSYVLVIE